MSKHQCCSTSPAKLNYYYDKKLDNNEHGRGIIKQIIDYFGSSSNIISLNDLQNMFQLNDLMNVLQVLIEYELIEEITPGLYKSKCNISNTTAFRIDKEHLKKTEENLDNLIKRQLCLNNISMKSKHNAKYRYILQEDLNCFLNNTDKAIIASNATLSDIQQFSDTNQTKSILVDNELLNIKLSVYNNNELKQINKNEDLNQILNEETNDFIYDDSSYQFYSSDENNFNLNCFDHFYPCLDIEESEISPTIPIISDEIFDFLLNSRIEDY